MAELGILDAVIMGSLQGLTEFLPISSSGHLRLAKEILTDLPTEDVFFEVYLHLATLIAVFIVLRKRIVGLIREPDWSAALLLSTIPAGLMVVLFHFDDYFEHAGVHMVLCGELATGIVLLLAERSRRRSAGVNVGGMSLFMDALFIGLFQGVAILPGVSRSGLSLCAAFFLGWPRDKAFEFVFLMSIPAVLGALVMHTGKAMSMGFPPVSLLLAGFIPALLLGWASLVALRYVVTRSLSPFGWYCVILGAVGLIGVSGQGVVS
ncbi:MAG: undecaprenyl-diphosphate phosphatase [Planctomycetota bacterium]